MKTAEVWMNQMSGLNNPALLTVNRMAIREIQLDAMKEGMRRAADLHKYNDEAYNKRMEVAAILTTAEQLTEKDL